MLFFLTTFQYFFIIKKIDNVEKREIKIPHIFTFTT